GVGGFAGLQSQCGSQSVALGAGEPVAAIQQRFAELAKSGKRKLHLRLDAHPAGDVNARRARAEVVEQRALADARLADEHQDSASARTNVGRNSVERGAFFLAAAELRAGCNV